MKDNNITSRNVADLRQQTVSGVGWTSFTQFSKQGMQFLISVVLARILSPEDFGLVGMVLVFTGFAALFGELGFGAALVQRDFLEERHYSSIFWLNLIFGILLTGLISLLAPVIANFYDEPRLVPLTTIIAINFLVSSLGIVQTAILNRNMAFRLIAIVETISVTIAGGVAVFLAWSGFGVWSLGWQLVITTFIMVIGFWLVNDWRPKFLFDWQAIKELLGFSSNLLGFNAFNYWSRNADNLLIGRFLGSGELGIYTRAYTTMLLPISQVTNVLSRVMFPALSKVQHDKARVKRIYLRSIAMIALLSFPMMMGLFVLAEPFILTVYGSKWERVISVIQILSLVGMVQSIVATVGWIYQSQGRTDWMFKWGLLVGSLGVLSFIFGIILGTVEAVALAYAAVNLLLLYWNFSIPGKLIDMKFSEVVASLIGVLGCAFAMAGLVWGMGLLLPANWPPWAHLMLQASFGFISYGLLVHFLQIPAYVEARTLLLEQLSKHRPHLKQTINHS